MAGFPAHLVWLGLSFRFACLALSLLALVIMYDGERMSSMWIRESCYFIEKHISFELHLKHVLFRTHVMF